MDVFDTNNKCVLLYESTQKSTPNAREINTCYHLYIFIPFFYFFSTTHRIYIQCSCTCGNLMDGVWKKRKNKLLLKSNIQ